MLRLGICAQGGPYLPDKKTANTVSHAMLAAYSSLPCGVFVLNEDRHLHFTHDLDATTYVTECSSGKCCKRHEGLTA